MVSRQVDAWQATWADENMARVKEQEERKSLLSAWSQDPWTYLTGKDLDGRPILWTTDERDDVTPVKPFPEEKEYLKWLTNELWHPDHRIVFVDDGSRDRSLGLLRDLQQGDPAVSYISLARNFGHQIAISAGLQASRADATIVMDGDLQDPPELIPALVDRWKAGAQIVYAQRTVHPTGSWLKSAAAYTFYRLLARLTNIEVPPDTGESSRWTPLSLNAAWSRRMTVGEPVERSA